MGRGWLGRNVLHRIPWLVVIVVGLALAGLGRGEAASQGGGAPGVMDLEKVKVEIVEATFVTELDGGKAQYKERQPDKYRGMLLTLRVTKPAGMPLKLFAPDLVLHYWRGEQAEVSRCFGLSAFSAEQGMDRPMRLFRLGYGLTVTGQATVKAGVLYVNAFFDNIEPDIREMHVLVTQSVGATLATNGWQK